MATPYGLAYGLGQMASAYLPGKMAGEQMAIDRQKQQQANQIQGLQLKGMQREEEDRALDEEIMSKLPEDITKGEGYMTPQAKQSALYAYLADEYGTRGKGKKAMDFHQKAVEAQSQHMAQMGGLGAQSLIRGNLDAATKYFNEATKITGDPIESIEPMPSPDGRQGFKIKTKSNPNGMTVGMEELAMMAASPDKIPGLIMNQYGKDMNYAIKEMVETNKGKRATAALEFKYKKLRSDEGQKELDRMGRETVARINAGGRVAAVAAGAVNQYVKNRALVKMTENPDLSPEQASAEAYEETKKFDDGLKLAAEARRSSYDVLRFGTDMMGNPKPGWEPAIEGAKDYLESSVQAPSAAEAKTAPVAKPVAKAKPKAPTAPVAKPKATQKTMTPADIAATAKSSGRSESEVRAAAIRAGYTIKE